ncbi:hypothetical protein JCM21142_114582 [Saccharicrinis fermentans DSM 9555 = JCM 21142]|uniref:Uncharacterized protein n=1 Tax=Saccharicrinis fermentans DSM 9555 = JCM 21142 TaxID=869213 RepID=W7YEC9_9BACT|nr:hypothetical protein JCM21142_114582 [Saccharicrinis fermentans DSM 9555 = JCM 21142]
MPNAVSKTITEPAIQLFQFCFDIGIFEVVLPVAYDFGRDSLLSSETLIPSTPPAPLLLTTPLQAMVKFAGCSTRSIKLLVFRFLLFILVLFNSLLRFFGAGKARILIPPSKINSDVKFSPSFLRETSC